VIARGDVWWADLPPPVGSEAGYRRPVVVVSGDSFNRSGLRTVVCVILTSQIRWAEAAGTYFLPASATGLPRDSVAQASLIMAIDKRALTERAGSLRRPLLDGLLAAVDQVLGRG